MHQRATVEKVRSVEAKRGHVRTVREAKKPSSPLETRVRESLGRKLLPEEAKFVGHVQELYNFARYRSLTELGYNPDYTGAGHLCFVHGLARGSFVAQFPAGRFLFWLYVAWKLRPRNVAPPPFMQAITDFAPIESEMRD